jgi:gamma-glutamylputrescine oxidase
LSETLNSGLGMADSYYAATANAFAPPPPLMGERVADLCVIGGGLTGVSAALHGAEAGLDVVLLEAGHIGWGASGRSGGQLIPGLRKGAAELIKSFGAERARALFEAALEARTLVFDLVARHDIACDLKANGHLTLAAKASDVSWMLEEVDALERMMEYPHARVVSREEAAALVNAPGFHGGLLDEFGAHAHPLNLTLGLADAARRAGASLHDQTRAVKIERGEEMLVRTQAGGVRAKRVVVACDALIGDLEPALARRIMPVANYLVATEPLADPTALIANDLAVSDSRFVVNYFRLSADGRLIFCGGERYSPAPPADMKGFVRRHMLSVFPQLEETRIDHAWGGLVSISMNRLPHIGREDNLFFAHGYSGQGLLMGVLAGKLLVEAMQGSPARFDLMAGIAPPEFPGGAALRTPLYVLGMLWYALRDRL